MAIRFFPVFLCAIQLRSTHLVRTLIINFQSIVKGKNQQFEMK